MVEHAATYDDAFSDFERQATRIWTSPVRAPGRSRNQQLNWWRTCYRARDVKRRQFLDEFLADPAYSICRVTGQIGAGKTSFLWDKVENPANRCCDGIIVDVGLYASRLAECQLAAYAEYASLSESGSAPNRVERWVDQRVGMELNRILAEVVEKRFRQHFWRLRCGLSQEYFDIDVSNRIEVDQIDPTDTEHDLYASEVNRDVAAALILVRTDDSSIELREEAFAAKNTDLSMSTRAERHSIVSEHLKNKPSAVSKVRLVDTDLGCSQLVLRWLHAYARFFQAKHLILGLDNLDRVFAPELHSNLIDFARRVAVELRSTKLVGDRPTSQQTNHASVFKVVFAIRDWNVPQRISHDAGGAVREIQIALADKGMANVDDHSKPVFLPLRRKLLRQIIAQRQSAVRQHFANLVDKLSNELASTKQELSCARQHQSRALHCNTSTNAEKIGLDSQLKELKRQERDYESRLAKAEAQKKLVPPFISATQAFWDTHTNMSEQFPLEELSNGSIRNALSVACHVVLQLMKDLQSEDRDLRDYISADYRFALRPRIIDWLFEFDESGRNLHTFIRKERRLVEDREHADYLCCTYRLILTHLWRRWKRGGWRQGQIRVGRLIDSLKTNTGTDPIQTRDALFLLFQCDEHQADYVTIYQDPEIVAAKDIQDDATIHINPRGIALIERVILCVEYWTRFAGLTDLRLRLYELRPEEALRLMEAVRNIVKRMAKAHEKNWKILVRKHMGNMRDSSSPMARFHDAELTVGWSFYLERVASAQMSALMAYFQALFRIGNARILVPTKERATFEARWPPLQADIDFRVDTEVAALDEPIRQYADLLTDRKQIETLDALRAIAQDFSDVSGAIYARSRSTYGQLFSKGSFEKSFE